MKITKIIPESDLRQITAANQSLENCEMPEHERELFRQIALGDLEIEPGKGYPLESVMREADTLLRDGSS
ncbi:MAG: hypothetical protein AMXMBFR82_25810 [Candidatus Hydrogenedentota bacterium]